MKGGDTMENMNTIVTLLSNFGFPIVCCGILMWYIFKLQEQHKTETDKMIEAINHNTVVMQQLIGRLEK